MSEHTLVTPAGRPYRMQCREGTTDLLTAQSSARPNNEYDLPQDLTGWAMDIGAHIGAVTVPLLLDNPGLRVVAVEALPENAAALRYNLELNGVESRSIVVWAAASDRTDEVRISYSLNSPPDDDAMASAHRFIGSGYAPEGAPSVMVRGARLRGLMLLRGTHQDEPIDWMKIDCEGCEYPFLEGGGDHLRMVRFITGEVHFGAERLRSILEPTHDVECRDAFGPFKATLR
jgi:FkbM family methyltransferase